MTSKDENTPPTLVPALAADISASPADPETVTPPSPPQVLLQSSVSTTSEPTLMGPPTPAHSPLSPSVRTSDGSVATLSRQSGRSDRTLWCHQARDNLTNLLSISPLTNSSPLVKAVVSRLFTISQMRAEKSAKIGPYSFRMDQRRHSTTSRTSYRSPNTPTAIPTTALIVSRSQCGGKWRWGIMISFTLRDPLHYRISQKPTWTILHLG